MLTKPSKDTTHYWQIHQSSQTEHRGDDIFGKFLLFYDNFDELDIQWARVKVALDHCLLPCINICKCSTAMPNPRASFATRDGGVIILYCPFLSTSDLYAIGLTIIDLFQYHHPRGQVSFKTNEQTQNGTMATGSRNNELFAVKCPTNLNPVSVSNDRGKEERAAKNKQRDAMRMSSCHAFPIDASFYLHPGLATFLMQKQKGLLESYEQGFINGIAHQKANLIRNLWINSEQSRVDWAFISFFPNKIGFFDIETTGLSCHESSITTIALYDGSNIKTFVRDQNLQEYKAAFDSCEILVSYHGKAFDMKFLEDELWSFKGIHIDLDYKFRTLKRHGLMPGYANGGLKAIEKYYGMDRNELAPLKGKHAPYLWERYKTTHDGRYLNTLLAYNCKDAETLVALLQIAYNSLCRMEHADLPPWTAPFVPKVPFLADQNVINEIIPVKLDDVPLSMSSTIPLFLCRICVNITAQNIQIAYEQIAKRALFTDITIVQCTMPYIEKIRWYSSRFIIWCLKHTTVLIRRGEKVIESQGTECFKFCKIGDLDYGHFIPMVGCNSEFHNLRMFQESLRQRILQQTPLLLGGIYLGSKICRSFLGNGFMNALREREFFFLSRGWVVNHIDVTEYVDKRQIKNELFMTEEQAYMANLVQQRPSKICESLCVDINKACGETVFNLGNMPSTTTHISDLSDAEAKLGLKISSFAYNHPSKIVSKMPVSDLNSKHRKDHDDCEYGNKKAKSINLSIFNLYGQLYQQDV